MTDTLSIESLNWALHQHKRYGDTDIFPVPFEIDAIEANWANIRASLSQSDLDSYSTSAARYTLMPKQSGCFRVAVQLDPIDSFVYSALLYEGASHLETHRIPAERRIACSFRLDIQQDGRVFKATNGWDDYHSRSRELAQSNGYAYVLVADIADFYNQAYHHRIETVLESAGISAARARNIGRYLGGFTAKQSRGLPVGPTPSILLAEACLDDVDKHLMRKGHEHVRYVDDFRVFCRSRRHAIRALEELTRYLYTAHRLTLQDSKTHIVDIARFIEDELHDPQEVEEQGRVDSINDLIERILDLTGYAITEDELLQDDLAEATIRNLGALFAAALARGAAGLGLAKYLLRRATKLRTRNIMGTVLANLGALAPMFREVCSYLEAVVPHDHTAREVGYRLLEFLDNDDAGGVRYVRLWSLELFARRPDFTDFNDAIRVANEMRGELGLRPAALLARAHSDIGWVREHKEIWNSHGPWDRRAIMWASTILPRAERRALLDNPRQGDDLLERSVALKALSLP